jgi:hypothetical protein
MDVVRPHILAGGRRSDLSEYLIPLGLFAGGCQLARLPALHADSFLHCSGLLFPYGLAAFHVETGWLQSTCSTGSFIGGG